MNLTDAALTSCRSSPLAGLVLCLGGAGFRFPLASLIMWLKRLGSDEPYLRLDRRERFVPLDRYYRPPIIRAAKANARLHEPLVDSEPHLAPKVSWDQSTDFESACTGCFFRRHAA